MYGGFINNGVTSTYDKFRPIFIVYCRFLYDIHRVCSLDFFLELPCIWLDLVHLPMSFLDLRIRRRHIYINMLILGLYNYWWLVTSFESLPRNKETQKNYLASVLALSVLLELLWKSILLVRYKLNILRPTHHIWELPVINCNKIMVIYPDLFMLIINQLLFRIIFIIDCICILML